MTELHWSENLPELKGNPFVVIFEVDTGDNYDFNCVTIVKNKNGYHVVSSCGCSCPSHEEQARYDAGPFRTYASALKAVPETHLDQFPRKLP